MKERPILFSSPMVRAILEGRKTQTRRIVKPRGRNSLFDVDENGAPQWSDSYILDPGNAEWRMRDNPFGVPGDRLWVRETWACHYATDDQRPGDIDPVLWSVRYAADGHIRPAGSDCSEALPEQFTKTRPSIFMPRWASRITLEITEVRVERLNDCSEADALAEGVPHGFDHHPIAEVHGKAEGRAYCRRCGGHGMHGALGEHLGLTEVDCAECDTPLKLYRNLWEHINGPDSWGANPWVWAVSFRRVEQERTA
jgi:hypothetical protein